jgi:hypothetical protein
MTAVRDMQVVWIVQFHISKDVLTVENTAGHASNDADPVMIWEELSSTPDALMASPLPANTASPVALQLALKCSYAHP